MTKPTLSHWMIRFMVIDKDGRERFPQELSSHSNGVHGVVAPTLEDAITLFRAQVPNAVIYCVNHQGRIHILDYR